MSEKKTLFYLLEAQDAEFPCRWIEDEPYIKDVEFQIGQLAPETIPQPLKYVLEPLDELASDCGPEMPAFFDLSYPLFRDDFLAAILEFGADNVQVFDAEIFDPDNQMTYKNYKAVNIIGLVKAADMESSEAIVYDGVPLLDVSFDRLVIDEKSQAVNFSLFRLAEKTTAILVSQDLKEFLVNRGFVHVCFSDLSGAAV